MKIHEYQAKRLFADYGIPVGVQTVAHSPAEARAAAERFGSAVVVKAQVLTGGRGKAGGVKLARNPEEARDAAEAILSLTIKGERVGKVLVTPAAEIGKEYYLGLILDRSTKTLVLMLSAEGGVDIEELAVTRPEAIVRFPVDVRKGPDHRKLRGELARVFGTPGLAAQAEETITKLYALFTEKDCSLVEINPYAQLADGGLSALDAKITFDDNALFRHPDIEALRNPEEESEDEREAKSLGLSFVGMDGEIGCIVNGAGLAMATMDIIKLMGGTPANFLDVGGSSNPQKVLNALRIILRNPNVKAILINIFGGITRCDDIANGILLAMQKIEIEVPLVVRLIGTNDEEGRRILTDAGFQVAEELPAAVERVVKLAREAKGGGR